MIPSWEGKGLAPHHRNQEAVRCNLREEGCILVHSLKREDSPSQWEGTWGHPTPWEEKQV